MKIGVNSLINSIVIGLCAVSFAKDTVPPSVTFAVPRVRAIRVCAACSPVQEVHACRIKPTDTLPQKSIEAVNVAVAKIQPVAVEAVEVSGTMWSSELLGWFAPYVELKIEKGMYLERERDRIERMYFNNSDDAFSRYLKWQKWAAGYYR